MTDLEKSMRTDLGKKDLIVDRKNCQRTSPKSVNFGQFFFQPLILYGKAIDFGLQHMGLMLMLGNPETKLCVAACRNCVSRLMPPPFPVGQVGPIARELACHARRAVPRCHMPCRASPCHGSSVPCQFRARPSRASSVPSRAMPALCRAMPCHCCAVPATSLIVLDDLGLVPCQLHDVPTLCQLRTVPIPCRAYFVPCRAVPISPCFSCPCFAAGILHRAVRPLRYDFL